MTHKPGHSLADEIIEKINRGGDETVAAPGAPRYDNEGNRIGYVGVADDYTAISRPDPMSGIRRPDSIDPSSEPVTPFYKAGSEDAISNMGADDIGRLQQEMVKAGLISKSTSIRWQRADESTLGAYKKLLTYANENGLTQIQALSDLQANPEMKVDVLSGGGGSVDKSGVRTQTDRTEALFTDPMTARDTVRTVMEKELGRAPDEAEYKRFVANLRSQEAGDDVSTTTSVYGKAGQLKSSSTMRADDTQDVSPDVLANQAVRSGALGRERNTKMAGVDYYQAAMNVLGAGGGNL